MHPHHLLRATALTLALVAFGGATARAQDLSLSNALADRAGQNIDLRAERELRSKLIERGLIPPTEAHVHVSAAFLERVFASERFFARVRGTKYHVGDRVLIEDKGSDGTMSPRAEIVEVLPDGKYRLKVWDKAITVGSPENLPGGVGADPFTGEAPPGTSPTKVRVRRNGRVVEETHVQPWLLRENERVVTVSHAELERLNGVVKYTGPHSVNRWQIDVAGDPFLRERVIRARAIADQVLPTSKLVLPEDPAERKAALEEIARLQAELLARLMADNPMDNPLRKPEAKDRLAKFYADNPDMKGKVGAVFESRCGVCVDQSAAMLALLNELGDRGITARAMSGRTIAGNFGHGFITIRLADGKTYLFDPSYRAANDKVVIDNAEFALFDARKFSNRRVENVHENTTHASKFVDPSSPLARDLERGYSEKGGASYLALVAKERATRTGRSIEETSKEVVAENKGKVDARLDDVLERAKGLDKPATPGMLGGLGRLIDRVTSRDRTRIR